MSRRVKAAPPQELKLDAEEIRLVAVFRRMNDEERTAIALIANSWLEGNSRSKAPSLRLIAGRPA